MSRSKDGDITNETFNRFVCSYVNNGVCYFNERKSVLL